MTGTITAVARPAAIDALVLCVLGPAHAATHALATEASVVVGRGAGCTIQIDDPSVSRGHATLDLATLTLCDHGSANGTIVRGERVAPHVRVAFGLDEVIRIGDVAFVIRADRPASRVLGRHYFALRLGEACARVAATGGAFALLQLAAEEPAALFPHLREGDLVGRLDGGELAVLLSDLGPTEAARIAADLERALATRVRLVCFPRDLRPPRAGLDNAHAMRQLEHLLARVAGGTITVLVLGETGVGKEVLAERIHATSKRAARPFLRLNCAALSETLLESELFGYEKGAFTGANATKVGLLESAHGGTVFLDEVGELPMATQVKLLRVLEQREVMRVGGLAPRPIDVRFVAATHRDLPAMIAAGTFRQDLYFRLNGITMTIPPLRERVGEIERLARLFVARAAEAAGGPPPSLSPAALDLLRAHRWPGNIRELRNVIERAVLLAEDVITEAAILLEHAPDPARPRALAPATASERDQILAALAAAAGNQKVAAQMLGVSRRTLINRLEQYGIARPRKGVLELE